jgi:hypothetical protein
MIREKVICAVCAALALFLVLSGCSKEVVGIHPQFVSEVEMVSGDKVRLFYGGTQEAKDIFCKGETVSIFRASPHEPRRYYEVGKVRIIRTIDNHYLEGTVVGGTVKTGDLARKGIAACLVVPFPPMD